MQTKEAANQALRKKITGRALIIFVVMLLLLTFFSNTINNLTLPRVTVESPMPGDIVKDISGQGIVEAVEIQEKYISSSAMVKEVKVEAGDGVKKGQAMMVLDTKEMERSLKDETDRYEKQKLQLEKLLENSSPGEFNSYEKSVRDAEKKVEQKQKAVEQKQKARDSTKELYDLGAESKKNLETAEADLETAEEDLEEAKQEHETAKFNREKALQDNERDLKSLRYDMDIQQRNIEKLREELNDAASVTAPCDGIVTEINFTKGTMANASQPLFKVIDTAKGYQLKVTMDEEKAKYLTAGEEADVTVESVSKRPIKGKITEISDNEQQKGEKKDIYIAINTEGLTGGEPGEISIKKRIETKGFLISNDAVHTDSSGDYILVVRERDGALGKEDYVQVVRITTGESDSSKTAVTGGMMMDRVVVKSSKSLEEGDRVIVGK